MPDPTVRGACTLFTLFRKLASVCVWRTKCVVTVSGSSLHVRSLCYGDIYEEYRLVVLLMLCLIVCGACASCARSPKIVFELKVPVMLEYVFVEGLSIVTHGVLSETLSSSGASRAALGYVRTVLRSTWRILRL